MKASPSSSPEDISSLLAQSLEHVADGIVLFDAQNRVLFFNAAAEAISGWPREEIIGRNVGILSPPAMRPRYDTDAYPAGQDRASELMQHPHDVQLVRKDGSLCWIGLIPSRVELGGRTVNLVFMRDTTAERASAERTRLLSLAFDEAHSAVAVTDGLARIVQVSRGFRELTGYDEQAAVGQVCMQLLSADVFEHPRMAEALRKLRDGQEVTSDERIYTRDGQMLWCSLHVTPIRDDYGNLVNLIVVMNDVTHTKIHEVLQTKMLAMMVQELPTAQIMEVMCREMERLSPDVVASVLRVDEHGRLRNLAAPSLPPSYCQDVEGVPVGPRTGCCGTAAYDGQPVLARDIATDPNWEGIADLALRHGLRACWSSPIMSSEGQVLATFAFYYRQPTEPTPLQQRLVEAGVHLCALALEREESRKRIRYLAFYDHLTGLPNRSLLHADADRAISAARQGPHSLAVLFIDIDRFKQINDSFGHASGDTLLRTVAERLREEAGPQDIVGRLSGDEFVMVLARCEPGQIQERLQSLQRRISAPLPMGDSLIRPSASIGVSLFPDNGHDMESLLHRADMAMYQAKRSGRNHYQLYSNEMNVAARERVALEAALREAIEHEQLHLNYQPQVNFADGTLHSVEALSRWTHAELGVISPLRFISLAEECGLITEIDQWALREACAQLARWRADGLAVPSVSVNLSPTNFHNRELPQRISEVLARHGLQPGDLTVEITEEVLLDTHPGTMDTLQQVHALGVRLSMDDFGTGYASLGYLRRLPISELKLDRSFVQDLSNEGAASALTQAVLHIGNSLELKVIAEGVETEQQAALLRDQGYHAAQGYLYSRPVAPEAIAAWLQQANAAGHERLLANS